jgi:transposase
MTKYHTFSGIDISKQDFYVAFHGNNAVSVYPNTEEGFIEFYTQHQETLKGAFVVLETTGGYEYALLSYLIAKKISVHRADTRKVKSFIRSFGRMAKTDRIDALSIAHYAQDRHASLKLFEPLKTYQQELRLLQERRLDLKQMIVQEKNRAKAPGNKFLQRSIEDILLVLQNQINEIDDLIKRQIKANPQLKAKKEVLMTIPGIGEATAHLLLALAPELGTTDRRKMASLCGLAPHPQQSGKRTGYSRMSGGRRNLRPHLFMAAMAARKSKSSLSSFYNHLIEQGKKPLVALGALMRKIITIANARLRDLTLYGVLPNAA